jgi:hypothetical protein
VNEEMIDPLAATEFTNATAWARVPKQHWSERHAFLLLALTLFAFWGLTIAAVYALVRWGR